MRPHLVSCKLLLRLPTLWKHAGPSHLCFSSCLDIFLNPQNVSSPGWFFAIAGVMNRWNIPNMGNSISCGTWSYLYETVCCHPALVVIRWWGPCYLAIFWWKNSLQIPPQSSKSKCALLESLKKKQKQKQQRKNNSLFSSETCTNGFSTEKTDVYWHFYIQSV